MHQDLIRAKMGWPLDFDWTAKAFIGTVCATTEELLRKAPLAPQSHLSEYKWFYRVIGEGADIQQDI